MADLLTPQDVEALAKASGKTIAQICKDAGIAHSTFTRWRAGETEPTLGIYRRLVAAAEAFKATA